MWGWDTRSYNNYTQEVTPQHYHHHNTWPWQGGKTDSPSFSNIQYYYLIMQWTKIERKNEKQKRFTQPQPDWTLNIKQESDFDSWGWELQQERYNLYFIIFSNVPLFKSNKTNCPNRLSKCIALIWSLFYNKNLFFKNMVQYFLL